MWVSVYLPVYGGGLVYGKNEAKSIRESNENENNVQLVLLSFISLFIFLYEAFNK